MVSLLMLSIEKSEPSYLTKGSHYRIFGKRKWGKMNVLKLKNSETHTILFNYNTTIKTFANGEKEIKHHSYSNNKGFPKQKEQGSKKSFNVEKLEKSRERQRFKNLYRTKQNIIDLAYHNGLIVPWEYFVTLTFDDKIVNANDYDSVVQALHKWQDNMKHQNPNMRYILAPEPHPTSGRIHFHGIFANVPNWRLNEARNPHTNRLIKKNGLQIYNLENYKYGYTTISKVTNLEAVSVYISKYITKELIDLAYKKRYWCSQGLDRPLIEYAQLDTETLLFHINKDNLKNYKEVVKENCTSIYLKTLS